jgi:hypothetical protein
MSKWILACFTTLLVSLLDHWLLGATWTTYEFFIANTLFAIFLKIRDDL